MFGARPKHAPTARFSGPPVVVWVVRWDTVGVAGGDWLTQSETSEREIAERSGHYRSRDETLKHSQQRDPETSYILCRSIFFCAATSVKLNAKGTPKNTKTVRQQRFFQTPCASKPIRNLISTLKLFWLKGSLKIALLLWEVNLWTLSRQLMDEMIPTFCQSRKVRKSSPPAPPIQS